MEQSDIKLLNELKKNRESAFDELFRKYFKNLTFFAMKMVKDRETAEEVVQDLFVNFWEKRHQLELKVSIKAYLYKAVYNNCIHVSKKEKMFNNDDLVLTNELTEDFDNILEQNELEVRIYGLIEQLPTECKRIFKLSRFEELKYKEIAERLQISIKTVETQMSRALKFLKSNIRQPLIKNQFIRPLPVMSIHRPFFTSINNCLVILNHKITARINII
ncbi:MAG: RNA polymerase sigma-70 factor, partial [Bacteroidales bacterium]|nr:RNA polymerase sigma-70 factor [Bacteroidales bacterium]